MYNDIIEKRIVKDGFHRIVLEISADEYNKFYEEHDNDIASEILNNYLVDKGDDGRASNIQIEYRNGSNIVKIFADIYYLGNDHTGYERH